MNITVRLTEASALSEEEIQRVKTLVTNAGEVSGNIRLDRCKLVALMEWHGRLVGTAAVKTARASYLESLSEKSGYSMDPEQFTGELGYLVTDPECRRVVAAAPNVWREAFTALLGRLNGHLFATTRTSNRGLRAVLRRHGFANVGHEWNSEHRADTPIGLWVRESLL